MRKKIVAGNWKMNTSVVEGEHLVVDIKHKLQNNLNKVEVILIPPFTHLANLKKITEESELKVGAQNCHTEEKGAYTGEISANMLSSLAIDYCLVGHSERRAYNFENNKEFTLKLKQLFNNNIQPIYCCGEQLEDRKSGTYFDVISKQLEILWKLEASDFQNLIIAYEPVWAIGTGETATADQAQEIHAFIRQLISDHVGDSAAQNTAILYGGSCKPSNSKELFSKPDVDGGLIGGASLEADSFVSIIQSF